jgi:hypothetical protein
LEVHRDHSTCLTHSLRNRHRESPGTAAKVQNSHAGPKIEMINDDRSAVGFREGIVEFNAPT